MIDNSKEYILCAAFKRRRPRKVQPYHDGTNDICDIEIGYRHHDILQRFPPKFQWVCRLLSCLRLYRISSWVHTHSAVLDYKSDGFYTSKGRWVNRYDGMRIAYEAGQVSKDKAVMPDYTEFDCAVFGSDFDKDHWRHTRGEYAPLFSEDLY